MRTTPSARAVVAAALRRGWLALAVLGIGLSWVAVAPAAGVRAERLGRAAVAPHGARALGALAAQTDLHLTLALEPRDPSGLAAYAGAVATPGSPDYHQYLSVAQFAQRFGANPTSAAAVISSLRSHGLNPGPLSANGLSVSVTGTAAQIEQAFSVGLSAYEVNGQQRYSADAAPLVAGSIAADVQSIDGLSDLAEPTAQPSVDTGGPQPTGSSCPTVDGQPGTTEAPDDTPEGGYYFPDQLATQYDLDGFYRTGDEGAGQTIALVEFEPYTQSDIDAYASCLGISDANVSVTPVAGGIRSATQSGEAALDIEDILGLAPQATIQVYEAPGSDESAEYNALVSATHLPQVISTSWGLCEPQDQAGNPGLIQSENTDFEEAAIQGQTVLAASGDSGSSACSVQGSGSQALSVDDPASQPFVTGVGGTSLADLGTPGPETVWDAYNAKNADAAAGGGGGYSSVWEEPTYQSSLNLADTPPAACATAASADGTSTQGPGCREVPDVSADADSDTGYAIYWDGKWSVFGGTSAAAPLWAAYIALANDSSGSACAAGSGKLGFLNPALYSAAQNSATYARDFNDVSSGFNATNGVAQGVYAAGAGYDMASGLGTPNGALLAGTLCGDPVAITKIANQTTAEGASVQLALSATTPDSGAVYSAFDLPPGITLSTLGVLSGQPTSAAAGVGTYFPTVVVSDDGATSEQTFTWTITAATAVHFSSAPIAGQSWRYGNAISAITVSATEGSAAVSYSAIGLPSGVSIDADSGRISGTPQFIGNGTALIEASTGGASPATEQFSWTSTPSTVTVGAVSPQHWTLGTPVTPVSVSATDSVPGRSYTYSSPDLPAGLTLGSSTGTISGTPTIDQSAPVTITVTDDLGSQASTTFTAVVTSTYAVHFTSPAISSQTWIETSPIQLSVTASDSAPPPTTITYQATGLPSGVGINPSTGAISGVADAAQIGTATITASSSNPASSAVQETFSWRVDSETVSVTPVPSQAWTVGTPVNLQIQASDTSPSEALSYYAGDLPPGVSLSPTTGLISGTPTAVQAATPVTVEAYDANDAYATVTFSVVIAAASVSSPSGGPPGNGDPGGGGSSGAGSNGGDPSGGGSTGNSGGDSSSNGSSGAGSTGSSTGSSTSSSAGGSSGAPSPTASGSTPSSAGSPPPSSAPKTVTVPSATATASGTATSRPSLVVKVKAAPSTKLTKLVIHLPAGFSASRTAKKIRAGIKVSVKDAKISVSGSAVTITLSGTSATITFSAADLSIARSLVTQVKQHKAKAEPFSLSVEDSRATTTLKLSLIPR